MCAPYLQPQVSEFSHYLNTFAPVFFILGYGLTEVREVVETGLGVQRRIGINIRVVKGKVVSIGEGQRIG